MQRKRRMTAEEFEVVRVRLAQRINATRLEAARLALVEGMTLQSVADRFNWSSRHLISKLVQPHERCEAGKADPERPPEPSVPEPCADRTGG